MFRLREQPPGWTDAARLVKSRAVAERCRSSLAIAVTVAGWAILPRLPCPRLRFDRPKDGAPPGWWNGTI